MTSFQLFIINSIDKISLFLLIIPLIISTTITILSKIFKWRTIDIKEMWGLVVVFILLFAFITSITKTIVEERIIKNSPQHYQEYKSIKLYSFENRFSQESNGRGIFFLGIGGVSQHSFESMRYYYTIEGEYGGLKLQSLEANFDRVEIIEDSDKTPQLKIYKAIYINPEVQKRFPNESRLKNKYIFIVPENTITNIGYNIDLE